MKNVYRWATGALLVIAALGLWGCCGESPGGDLKLSREGESCTRSADCAGDLGCHYQRCVDRSRPVGSSAATAAAYTPAPDSVPQLR